MSLWIKTRIKNILQKYRKGRGVTIFPDDLIIVSYPKSGNTWTRFLIGNLLSDAEPITFANIEQKVPAIYVNTDAVLRDVSRPRLLTSHEYFDPRYRKVIYIVRDPRDVAVSYYHHHRKFRMIPEGMDVESFVELFIDGQLDNFGSWGDNVGSWLGARGDNKEAFIVLRYENLLLQPEEELGRVLDFLGRKRTPEAIRRAIELSSADRMRELEAVQAKNWVATKHSNQSMPFVRKAKSGGWKDELSPQAADMIINKWRNICERLGYIDIVS